MTNRIKDIIDKITAEPASTNDIIVLQRELVKIAGRRPFGKRFPIDGIYGSKTKELVNSVDQDKLFDGLRSSLGIKYHFKYDKSGNRITDKKGNQTLKDLIMEYLAEAEGTTVHKNSGERYITAPYGIYYGAHPQADIFKLLDKIGKANGIKYDVDIDKINKIIKDEYEEEIKTAAWNFYMSEMVNRKLFTAVGKKSGLSIFSNSVNAGVTVGNKSVQRAVGVIEDGIIGSQTMKAINEYKYSDDKMNQDILKYMEGFYKSLVEQDPAKYYRFLNGWMNRLKRLGYNT